MNEKYQTTAICIMTVILLALGCGPLSAPALNPLTLIRSHLELIQPQQYRPLLLCPGSYPILPPLYSLQPTYSLPRQLPL